MQLGTRCSDGSCEATEDLIAGFSAIEAEAELIQVRLKLLTAAVIRAEQETPLDYRWLCAANAGRRVHTFSRPAQRQTSSDSSYNQRDGGNCQWWLRSPGFEGNCAAIVGDDGGISSGHYVGSGTVAIRPILWIDLDA